MHHASWHTFILIDEKSINVFSKADALLSVLLKYKAIKVTLTVNRCGYLKYLDYNRTALGQTPCYASLTAVFTASSVPSFIRTIYGCRDDRHSKDFILCSCTYSLQPVFNQQSKCLDKTSTRDSLLNCCLDVFPIVQEELKVLDGCYLAAYRERYSFITSGMATQTFGKMWDEHLRAAEEQQWKQCTGAFIRTVPLKERLTMSLEQRVPSNHLSREWAWVSREETSKIY
jgi:hypothetical protein